MPSTPDDKRELVLTRLIDVPRDKLFRCWTEPALIVQWFTPPRGRPCMPSSMSALAVRV